MIDFGLLASMIVAFGLPSVLNRWRWSLRSFEEPVGFLDVALAPAVVAVVAGRLAAVALDDPAGLTRFGDLLIIRSGVEFWAGLLGAVLVVAWSTRTEAATVAARLAALAPLAMVGYAGYEATCILRDGCFGPVSSIGLKPPGLATSMFPVGVIVGAAVGLGAILLRRLSADDREPVLVVAGAAVVVAGVRAVASLWLPHVGEGLTRPHQISIVVAAVALVTLAGSLVRDRAGGSAPA